MELIINIKDKKMYDSFVQFFKSLGIAVISSVGNKPQVHRAKKKLQDITDLPVTVAKKDADFKALAGIWANRNVTLNEIRQVAWGNRK